AEYAGSMGVGEVDAALGQAIDIWGDGGGCCVVASDPVVHVIDRDEKNIRFSLYICFSSIQTACTCQQSTAHCQKRY
ncbi:MAG: hypothetical protein MK321_14440, partial [Pseudomonadales bacterium]|nr:hypothetical protein [Pseudomonadales bacterium]